MEDCTHLEIRDLAILSWILKDKRLNSNEKIIFQIIYNCLKYKKICQFTNQELSENINKSLSTINRILKKLVCLELISVSEKTFRRQFKLGNEFTIRLVK